MGVAVTGWMGWVEGKKRGGMDEAKRVAESPVKKVGQNRLIIF